MTLTLLASTHTCCFQINVFLPSNQILLVIQRKHQSFHSSFQRSLLTLPQEVLAVVRVLAVLAVVRVLVVLVVLAVLAVLAEEVLAVVRVFAEANAGVLGVQTILGKFGG